MRANGKQCRVGKWGLHLQDVFARSQRCDDQGAGGLQQGQGVMGLQGPTHLAGQAKRHQLRNGQNLHCRAKGVPAPSATKPCYVRKSSLLMMLVHFPFFHLRVCSFCFSFYSHVRHTQHDRGRALISSCQSGQSTAHVCDRQRCEGACPKSIGTRAPDLRSTRKLSL